METRRTLLVDAFADEPLAGNAAGVVPNAAGLSDDQMQRIAAELGASETAFLLGSDEADERLRYFTPATEVDLCGHATIAAYGALFEEGAIDAGDRTLRTNVGDLDVTVDDDGTVWMGQNPPSVERIEADELDADRLGDALGIDPAALRDVGADLPVAVATTGLPWLVVPVNFLERLGEAAPDSAAVEAVCAAHDAVGIYAYTFDALDPESTLHGRAFAPAVGVQEDPVTGTASGAVGAYLQEVGAFDGDFPDELRFEQGHFINRPGHVRVRVAGDEVRVGGDSITSLDGDLRVPAADRDDDIIEA